MQATEGLSQKSRWLKALDLDYIDIEGHSFEELIAFSVKYAELLNFYDTDNKLNGDWKQFFTADLTVILALIITEDIEQYKANYRNDEELIRQTGSNNGDVLLAHYESIFNTVIRMAEQFNFWISELRRVTSTESAFHDELEQAVKELKGSYEQLHAYRMGAEREEAIGQPLKIEFKGFAGFKAEEVTADHSIYEGENRGEKIKHAVQHLKPLFDSFYDTLTYLKAIAPQYLEESLTNDDHSPQIGLLFTFLQLFKKAQGSINCIKERHMDFYYREVLQQNPRPAIPDKVNVCLQLSDGADSFMLPKGTRFNAGKDEKGNIRLFESEEFVHLNHALIQELRTLYVSKNKYVEVGSPGKLASGMYESRISRQVAGGGKEQSAWPTLGEDQIGVSNAVRTMQDATIGFAVASPAFLLKEGNRDINLEITFNRKSFSEFKKQIQTISDGTNSTFGEVFFKAFRRAFRISVTSEEGWIPIRNYGVEAPFWENEDEDNSIAINFLLSYAGPALVNYDPEIHGSGFDSKWPMVQIILNKDSYIYPYSLLSGLILEEIAISTKVDEVTDLVVYNDLGQLSIDKPFQPFGPVPKPGSYLMIGSKEVFTKAVTDLSLTFEWQGLPQQDGGFSDYYRAYEGYNINNASFKVNFSLLKDGKWKYPESGEIKTQFLFETEGKSSGEPPHPFSALKDTTTFEKLPLDEFKLSPNYTAGPEPLSFTKTTKNGFVKFELTGDEVMFGHKKYPLLVSEVFLENAQIKKEKYKKEIPNEPYTPVLENIRLGYSDHKSIKFITEKGIKDESSAGEVYHIMPFQFNKKIYPSADNDPVALLPAFEETGNLYIGLTGLEPPDELTLFFKMEDKNVASFEDTRSDLKWYYLADNTWHKLADNQVLSDSTQRLLRSGIVTLELPRSVNKKNTILEDSMYWIKVSGTENIDMIGNTVEIWTQAATLTWVEGSSTDSHLASGLPAQTITSLEKPVPEIAGIFQPGASFGGKTPEKDRRFYTRNSERLRHKNRAIVSRDYEQLILEKFPQIYKVNCLQSASSHADIAPGNVLIAVIPKLTAQSGGSPKSLPMANVSLLREIKDYVHELASPFVQIEVRNPNYERVRVVCAVRFREGFNNGQTIKKLNHDLRDFLSPWFYDSVREIWFGSEINISDVSGFIYSREYVTFVTKLSLLKVNEYENDKYSLGDTAREEEQEGGQRTRGGYEALMPSKPWSVLVSANKHHIELLPKEEARAAQQTGINDLELGNSFIID